MKKIDTPIPDLFELMPAVYGDHRGYFYESYNRHTFAELGLNMDFVQDNQSLSSKGVLRGLHFQAPPHAQGKLVRVIHGAVLDVALDIRQGSPTYGKHHTVLLSGENQKMFWIPEGFAHGFLTLEDETVFCYKCTGYYAKEAEGSILWNDPDLDIEWKVEDPQLSVKDREGIRLKDFNTPFIFND